MHKQNYSCFRCGETEKASLNDMYNYVVCNACVTKLGLYHDETIKKHMASFQRAKDMNPEKLSYEEEVNHRLIAMEKDYISKRIKLLHIRERLKNL